MLLFIMLCLTNEVSGQIFNFSSPAKQDEAPCGLRNVATGWTLKGTVTLTPADLLVYAPTVTMTATTYLCTVDLNACGTTENATSECACLDKAGSVHTIVVRLAGHLDAYGSMLKAEIESADIFDSQKISANIGVLSTLLNNPVSNTSNDTRDLVNTTCIHQHTTNTSKLVCQNDTSGNETDCQNNTLTTETSCSYTLLTLSDNSQVVCNIIAQPWVVIQRRVTSEGDFYRGWNDYNDGFGNLTRNFWWGLNNTHNMCNPSSPCQLQIDMGYKGENYIAQYGNFSLTGETDNYRLYVSDYSGTAGDNLSQHSGMMFTTKDRKNDANGGPQFDYLNCARQFQGAWWYTNCMVSNLNGRWGTTKPYGMRWDSLQHRLTGSDSVDYSEMKVRPVVA